MAEETKETKETTPKKQEKQEKFSHGEIVVQARPEAGFRRAGIHFSGKEKTVIQADSLSEERYNAIMNERQLLAVEGVKAFAKDATPAVEAGSQNLEYRTTLGGSLENATPEQLRMAEEEGVAIPHPAVTSSFTTPAAGQAKLDPEMEKHAQKMREYATAKRK